MTIDGLGGTDSITLANAPMLGSATSSGHLSLTAETLNINADINTDASTTGTHGGVTLAATSEIFLGANVTIDSDGGSLDGEVTVAGDINGGNSLLVQAGDANVSLQNVGNDSPLASLQVNSNVVTLHASTLAAVGSINLLPSAGVVLASECDDDGQLYRRPVQRRRGGK